jgi:hypothetical protein
MEDHLRRLLFFCVCFCLSATFAYSEKPTVKPQQSFAPYWTAEPGWETELQLRNNLVSGELTVVPALRLANGREITLDSVSIPASDAVSIQVADALSKHAPETVNQPGTFGSVIFKYPALHARNLSVAVMIHMHGQPIGYHVDAYPVSSGQRGGSLEGIWWQPHSTVKDILAFSNSSEKTVDGTLVLFDSAGKSWREAMAFPPHQSQRVDIADLVRTAGLSGSYGGLTLDLPVRASALDCVHFLYDESAGFSALMQMFGRDPSAKLEERTWAGNQQWTSWAPMLALQNPDPAAGFPAGTSLQPLVLLRNVTAKKTSANFTLSWRGDSSKGKVQLPRISLRPFETRMVDIAGMQKQLGIPRDAHWALVKFTSTAAPDDLIAVASSFDGTGRYGAQTPFSDNLGAYWSGGQWRVDATHNALVAVTNGGTRATDALLTLHYNHGQQKYEIQQTIQPGDQMWLNFADLVHNAVPDRKGRTLPPDLSSGTYDLEDLDPGLGGNLIEGKVSLDKTWGHLAYGCLTCCGYSPFLLLDPTFLGVGGNGAISADGTNNCSGAEFNLRTYFSQSNARWWAGNTSIAGVTSFNGHGVAPGSTGGFATATTPSGDGQGYKICPQTTQEGTNQVTVAATPINLRQTAVQDQRRWGPALYVPMGFFDWQPQ